MTDLSGYQERVEALNDDIYLGRVVWYSLSEASRINHGEFCLNVHNEGMNWDLPPVVQPHDLFRRVTTDAQRRKVPLLSNGIPTGEHVNYNFREVGCDADHIWRQLVAEVLDRNGHRLTYAVLHEVTFHRNGGLITDQDIAPDGTPLVLCEPVADIVEQVRVKFNEQYDTLTPFTIREYVRRVIRNCGATVLRDGVYFIKGHQPEIDALDNIVNVIPGGMFHSLPLIDDRKQRDMLRQAFEDESVVEIDKLINEVTEFLREGKKVTTKKFGDFLGRYNDVRVKVVDYSDLLDTAMVLTATRLEVVSDALGELAGKVT